MSAPNFHWWLPSTLVQLFTNWNCCSLSTKGQLQRPTFKPSPKFDHGVPVWNWKLGKPDVNTSPKFTFGIPNAVAASTPSSGLCVVGLYLNQPNRKSVNKVELNTLSKPAAKL